MEIEINKLKPSFIVYHYDGFVMKNNKKYNFEIIDAQNHIVVNWIDWIDSFNRSDIEEEIINKYINGK